MCRAVESKINVCRELIFVKLFSFRDFFTGKTRKKIFLCWEIFRTSGSSDKNNIYKYQQTEQYNIKYIIYNTYNGNEGRISAQSGDGEAYDGEMHV